MIEFIITKIAVALLMRFGVSSSLAALLAPRVIKIVKDAAEVAKQIKRDGATDAGAVEIVDSKILLPRQMTKEEEQRWFDRATGHGG